MDVEVAWAQVLEKICSLPPDWNEHMADEQRFDALSKQLCFSELYTICPKLRRVISSNGGLAKLWGKCHGLSTGWREQEAWDSLLQDLQHYPFEDRSDISEAELGTRLSQWLDLPSRMKQFPELRRRLKCEGGLSQDLKTSFFHAFVRLQTFTSSMQISCRAPNQTLYVLGSS